MLVNRFLILVLKGNSVVFKLVSCASGRGQKVTCALVEPKVEYIKLSSTTLSFFVILLSPFPLV